MPRDPLHTELCDRLGIETPIIAFTHCRDVAVAVIHAGGFAVLGEAMRTADEIAADTCWMREHAGGRGFGIDLVLPSSSPRSGTPDELYAEIPETHREFAARVKQKYSVPEPSNAVALRQWGGLTQEKARAQIEVLIDERVPVIATGLGCPDFLFEAAHARGLEIFALVGQVKHALRQIDRGADVVVAQGYDAAGHTGAMGTFSLVPAVVSAARGVPVVAAGGITTGRHVAAALCLGAAGVWTGTAWLASYESDIDPLMKERILAASGEDTDRSASVSGKTMRVLRCPWTEEWSRADAPPALRSPYQMLLSSNYLQGANDARRADLMTEAVGQGVAFVKGARASHAILGEMTQEARATLRAHRVGA